MAARVVTWGEFLDDIEHMTGGKFRSSPIFFDAPDGTKCVPETLRVNQTGIYINLVEAP